LRSISRVNTPPSVAGALTPGPFHAIDTASALDLIEGGGDA
jgi:hypothetical protein